MVVISGSIFAFPKKYLTCRFTLLFLPLYFSLLSFPLLAVTHITSYLSEQLHSPLFVLLLSHLPHFLFLSFSALIFMSSEFLRQLYQIFAVLCIRFVWHAFKQSLLVTASSPALLLSDCFGIDPLYLLFQYVKICLFEVHFPYSAALPPFLKNVMSLIFTFAQMSLLIFNKFFPAILRSNCHSTSHLLWK